MDSLEELFSHIDDYSPVTKLFTRQKIPVFCPSGLIVGLQFYEKKSNKGREYLKVAKPSALVS